jgi:hypothetical protein
MNMAVCIAQHPPLLHTWSEIREERKKEIKEEREREKDRGEN